MDKSSSADIVILTLKPDDRFIRLIHMLEKQTVTPGKIIIVNTEESFFKYTDMLHDLPETEIHHIEEKDFNHGLSRNFGASLSNSRFLVFMTQDAVPEDENLLLELLTPMENESVAVSYASRPSLVVSSRRWSS